MPPWNDDLLHFCRSFLRLERLLLIALDHDNTQEAANHSTANEEQDDGNANGPDARRKELLYWVRIVDEWLVTCQGAEVDDECQRRRK